MRLAAVFLLALVGVSTAHKYLTMRSEEVDSEEHGVTPGRKTTTCKCGWANRASSRIVGGRETKVNQFPFSIGITPRNRMFIFCGGTIISEYHVLTAAHCTVEHDARNLAVVVGEHNVADWRESDATEIINVRTVIEHPRYSHRDSTNDIALIELVSKIPFSSKVGPACLPQRRNEFDLVDKYIKVMGWGTISTGGPTSLWLRHVNLRVIPLDICKNSFRRTPISLTNPTQICTFSKRRDSCQGDSGGPVVYLDPQTNRYTLIGVVSFGADCASSIPGVNTDVSAFLDWIQTNMAITNPRGKTCRKL